MGSSPRERDLFASGTMPLLNQVFAASFNRTSSCVIPLTSPVKPTSPRNMLAYQWTYLRRLRPAPPAMPRSTAGSSILTPPVTFRKDIPVIEGACKISLQHRSEQRYTMMVNTDRGSPWNSQISGTYQCLYFHQQRPCSLHAGNHNRAGDIQGTLERKSSEGLRPPRDHNPSFRIHRFHWTTRICSLRPSVCGRGDPGLLQSTAPYPPCAPAPRGPAMAPSLVTCPMRRWKYPCSWRA